MNSRVVTAPQTYGRQRVVGLLHDADLRRGLECPGDPVTARVTDGQQDHWPSAEHHTDRPGGHP
ncbi:hypothetical protein FNH04_07375 [Streptomyces phyllanthi]|uniref:Uncharacterized protein n=1 Tax=Streptomyces phyllanthi TaxID=1803180 RepID=A0A5N8W089_9ACTN|nr:hypothetical protein [Streptomyces phyllanthi]